MIYLLFSILSSVLTVSIFKVIGNKNLHTLQAIVANYVICFLVGSLIQVWDQSDTIPLSGELIGYAVLLGSLFISIFYCIALTAQRISVSVSVVAAKLSVVIPVVIAILAYHESVSMFQWAGIIISLGAVYLISGSSSDSKSLSPLLILLPVLVFLGSGVIDALLNYLQQRFIPPYSAAKLVSTAFLSAGIIGFIWVQTQLIKQKSKWHGMSLAYGAILGIPNYFSMFLLVKALDIFPATWLFPVNNIGIVLVATLSSRLVFGERLQTKSWIGLILAVLSIVLLSLK